MVSFDIGWYPIWILLLGILVVLTLDQWKREKAQTWVSTATAIFLVTTSLAVIWVNNQNLSPTSLFKYGDFYYFFALIGLLSSLLVIFVAWRDMRVELDLGVFYSLLMLANIGGLVISSANQMLILYVGYELVSLPSYAMAAFRKRDKPAAEAALKFFLLGALSSAIIVYGLALYYGATGTLAFNASTLPGAEGLKFAAIVLIASGSGFKIGLVPFHFWIADVYSGSPLSVVTWLAASSKIMAFAFVIQLFFVGMGGWADDWGTIFVVLSIFSMLLGNIAAVIQTSVMRILAYSTIAQAGYIMIGFAAFAVGTNGLAAINGIGMHIVAQVLMKGGAVICTFVVIDNLGSSKLENFRGLFQKNALVAVSMVVALLSLMGIPPLLGAFGKFFLFNAAVENNLGYLAIIGLIGSAISIYYYMKIVTIMMEAPTDDTPLLVTRPIQFILLILTGLTILLPIILDEILVVLEGLANAL